jgi:hypothetical protein
VTISFSKNILHHGISKLVSFRTGCYSRISGPRRKDVGPTGGWRKQQGGQDGLNIRKPLARQDNIKMNLK